MVLFIPIKVDLPVSLRTVGPGVFMFVSFMANKLGGGGVNDISQ